MGRSAQTWVASHCLPMKSEQVVELLAQTRLFGGLGAESLQAVAAQTVVRSFRKGTIVVSEGEPGGACYVIASGSAKVFVSSPHGQEMVLATLHPPDAFGELALFDGESRSASVEALEDIVTLALARSTLLETARRQPAITDALLCSIAALVRRTTTQAADLVFLDLEGRVAKLLVGLAEERGTTKGENTVLDLALTQRDLASRVGGSRQSVNHVLHALQSRGFLELHGREVLIVEPEKLRQRAEL
jgi:CRP/FNR family transcriptional regulator, cyclic AMP receptor protein